MSRSIPTKEEIKQVIKSNSKFMIVNYETKNCVTQEGFDELAENIYNMYSHD